MGNIVSPKNMNDYNVPEITDKEIKELTYIGFTEKELRYLRISKKEEINISTDGITNDVLTTKKTWADIVKVPPKPNKTIDISQTKGKSTINHNRYYDFSEFEN
jgi:hypothetical protein